ncbi:MULTISPECIES: cupin domain-containing protein [Pantoea]|uniref:cupin domain-containing protein n=1 Tax=Pantoea TaxID=53335 RepID=UPI002FDB87D0
MISNETAEHYTWGDHCDGWYLLNRPDLMIIHEKMPAGTAEVRHYHAISRQFFFVLEGTLTMALEGREVNLSARQGIEIAPDRVHQARNDSDVATEFLVISHPTPRGDRFDAAPQHPDTQEA